jgi:mono/diheme cytochrome c family protein
MTWKLIKLGIALGLGFAGFFFYSILVGEGDGTAAYWPWHNPRMRHQRNIRDYDARMPLPPAGAVPTTAPAFAVPTSQAAAAWANPLAGDDAAVQRGAVYFQYYCICCHGRRGDGHGPVGESYPIRPAELYSPRIKALSDGQLLVAMLTGPGHEPVLGYTVLPQHRWPLVAYIRMLQAPPPPTTLPTPASQAESAAP